MFDLVAHLTRQFVFSKATFGPGPRAEGVLNHMEKEIAEVRKELIRMAENDVTSSGWSAVAEEWVDLVILSLDGLTRSVAGTSKTMPADQVAIISTDMILRKQSKNELRIWPDWRTADPDKAIEHVRGTHD